MVIVNADKTGNKYEMSAADYKQLLHDNITRDYKLDSDNKLASINIDTKNHAKALEIDDRMECHSEANAFLTIKDHKEEFPNNIKCRVINPASNNLGKISKRILDKVNTKCREATGVNQWRSTQDVLQWFSGVHAANPTKKKARFLQFNINEFYPSISEELLQNSIRFAKNHATIEQEEEALIMDCRKSILFNDGRAWTKKEKNFDVTMGAQDGAEIAELTGIYLLQQVNDSLSKMKKRTHTGLYRDDGLIYIEDASGPLISRIEKTLHRIFKSNKLSISLEQKGHVVNFLDVTMDTDGTHKPYKKPNSKITYVSKASNHPPSITKNIPKSIGRRLNTISRSEAEFNNAKDDYQQALSEAGYSEKLTYDPEQSRPTRGTKRRRRNIVWFNPPYSRNVATNIGKEFFNLLRIHFPVQHPLHRLFNRNTVKLSYSCTMNLDSIIKAHNAKILNKEKDNSGNDDKTCNCRDQTACPVGNNCLKNNVVYKATVQYEDKEQNYIGMTENTFKTRYTLHKASFKHSTKRKQTELSNLIWTLKDNGTEYKLTWSIINRARPYQPGKRTCNLCLSEKFHILTGSHLINRKTELLNKCPHRRKYITCNVKA